ncbi:MAG: hypothetical protein ABIF88_01530 [archaeon]
MRRFSKGGQIWVETVIYTLIGIAIIGIVLSIAKPKIDAKKDEAIIDQSIEALGNIGNKVYDVVGSASGSRRIAEVKVGKGEFKIDMENDKLIWIIDSSYEYSQQDVPIMVGKISVTTKQGGDPYQVILEMDYNFDLQYEETNTGTKSFLTAPVPYDLMIENDGLNNDGNIVVMFRGG